MACSASSLPPWSFLAPALATTMTAWTGRSVSWLDQTPAASVSTATRASAVRRSFQSTLWAASRTCSFPPTSSHRRPTSACRCYSLAVYQLLCDSTVSVLSHCHRGHWKNSRKNILQLNNLIFFFTPLPFVPHMKLSHIVNLLIL